MEKLWEVVQVVLHRAVLAVGVLATLLTLAAAGLLLAWRHGDPVWLLLTLFGALGAAEVFHRQQKADLVERREVAKESLLLDIQAAHPDWHPKVLKEFEHGGLLFRVVGDALGRGALWQGGSVVTVVSLLVFAASAA